MADGNYVLQCICWFLGAGSYRRTRWRMGNHGARRANHETRNRNDEDGVANQKAAVGKHETRMGDEDGVANQKAAMGLGKHKTRMGEKESLGKYILAPVLIPLPPFLRNRSAYFI